MTPTKMIASLCVAAILGITASSASALTFNTEKLSVTINDQAVGGDGAAYGGLWVGDVVRNGKTVTWVELTDRYGEVVYEAAIQPNETHLLPDGYALTVRDRTETSKKTVKMYTDRVAPDANRVATYRITVDPSKAAKEPSRQAAKKDDRPDSGVLATAQRYVSDAVRLLKTTVRGVRIAWL